MTVIQLWPVLSLFLLATSSLSTETETSEGPLRVPENGILTRSWKSFENLVQTAFEEDEQKESGSTVPVHDKLEAMRQEMRRRFARYKAQVEKVHGLGDAQNIPDGNGDSVHYESHSGKSRKRRAVITADNIQPGRRRRNITEYNTGGTSVVRTVYPLKPQPFDFKSLADLNVVQIKGQTYLFALEESPAGSHTSIYKVDKDLNPREVYRLKTPGATTIEVFEIEQQYYVLPGEYDETSQDPIDAGSNLYRFDLVKNTLDKVQTINTEYARSLRFWVGSGQEANDVFFLVAPEYMKTAKGISYKVGVSVYRWQGAYLDYLYEITAYNPQAVQYAMIYSTGYLAIANYQDDSKSTSINSEILRYNHKESRYVSFQKILTHGAKDIQFFSITNGRKEENYLAIANHVQIDQNGKSNFHVKSYILKYATERYIPFQSIATYGAFQILPVKLDSISFLVIGELTGIRIVQYNGWRFTEKYSIKFADLTTVNALKFRSFIHGKQPYFTIASTDQNVEGGIYALEFETRNDHSKMTADLETWCARALKTVDSEDMAGLEVAAAAAPKSTDREIVLPSSLTFTGDLNVKSLFGKTLSYAGLVFDAQTSKRLASQEAQLKLLEEELQRLEVQLSQVVLKNADQTIHTEIRFEDVYYKGLTLRANSVRAQRLNGYRLSDLFSKLIFLDKNYSFGTVNIEQLKTNQHIQVEKLNGHLLSDFAIKSATYTQTFTEKNQFVSVVTVREGFLCYGLVDGVNFHIIDFLLKSGNQTFVGGISIRDSTINNLIAKLVNKVDLEYYYEEAVSKIGSDTITGNKYFDKVAANSFQASSISGVDINQLYEKAIYITDVPVQTFEARETNFEQLTVDSISLSTNSINERYDVQTDFVSISSGTYNIDSMELLYDTYVDQLTVNRSLNKIQVIDGNLDIILKDSSATQLIGNKAVDSLILEKNSIALGLIDGVNLTGWSHEKFIELRENRIRIGRFTTAGYLSVPLGIYIEKYGKFYQGASDISLLLSKALTLNATQLPDSFHGTVRFKSAQVLGNTQVRTINTLSPSYWLTNRNNGTAVVTGKKVFTGDITLSQSATAKALFYTQDRYGENVLLGFGDLLIDGTDQTILRNSVFNDILRVDSLTCPAVVFNGVPFQNLLLVDGSQEVQGQVTFSKSVRVKNSFIVNGNVDTELLNGFSLTSVIQDTLRTYSSSPQVFQGTAVFENGLTVHNINTQGLVGGYNLSLLLENIIPNNGAGNQVIEGSLTFAKAAKLDKLEFKGTLNGIKDTEWGDGFLLSTGHQVIYTPTRFQGHVSVHNLTVTNEKVSNFDFVRLANEILRLDQAGTLGRVSFENTVNAGSNVRLSPEYGRVSGFRVREDLLLRNGPNPQIITADKTFRSGWRIDGFLSVKYLAGIDYNQAAKFAFGLTSPQDSLRIEGNLVLKNEPAFSHSFDGQDWDTLVNGILWTNQAATLGQIQFSHIVLQDGGFLSGNLSGVDLAYLQKWYLSISKDQRISGKFTFDNGLSFKDLSVDKVLLNGGRINGINLDQFRDSVLLDGVDQTLSSRLTFDTLNVRKLDMEPGALVGGLDLDGNTVRLHSENVVTGQKTLENLNIGELSLGEGTLLAGINLKEWTAESISTYETANVTGNLDFFKASFSRDVIVQGFVDQLKFTRDKILTLSGDQTVTGSYTFSYGAEFGSDAFITLQGIQVEGLFDGFNLEKVIATLVQRDAGTGPLIVTGEKTFARPLNIESLQSEALYQGYNINETLDGLKPEAYLFGNYNYSLEEKYLELNKLALDLHSIARHRAIFLEYYEVSSSIETKASTVFRTLHSQAVLASAVGSLSTVNWWSLDVASESFQLDLTQVFVVNGIVRDFVSITSGNISYVIVTVNSFDGQVVSSQNQVHLSSTEGEAQLGRGGLSKMYVLKLVDTGNGNALAIHQIISGANLGQLLWAPRFNEIGSAQDCIVVNADLAYIFCFNGNFLQQTKVIPVRSSNLLASVLVKLTTYYMLSTAETAGTGSLGEVVEIWASEAGKIRKIDCHPIVNLISMDTILGSFNQAYLALASGQVKGTQYFGAVYIYRFTEDTQRFTKIQTISVRKPLAVKFQTLDPVSTQQLLYILTRSTVYVYSYQGLSGFVLEHELSTEGATGLEVLTSTAQDVFKAQVLVQSAIEVSVFTIELNGFIRYRNASLSFSSSSTTSEHLSNSAYARLETGH